ncbi:MAG: hypothetical protein WCP16_21320 [Pseudanabaena sp. ELA645]
MLIFGKSYKRQIAIASQIITSQDDRYSLKVKPRSLYLNDVRQMLGL